MAEHNSAAAAEAGVDDNDAAHRFEDAVRAIWAKPTMESSMFIDLPRLVRRVTIRTREGVVLDQKDSAILTPGTRHMPTETFGLICKVVLLLVENLEQERLADVKEGLASISAEVDDSTELMHVLPAVSRLLQDTSKTHRLLKMINQNIVLLAVTTMKESITSEFFTKDVKSADGWRVVIDLFETVQLYHRRREQSLDMPGDDHNHFDFDYEVKCTFDRELTELYAAGLRVIRLNMSDTMEKQRRAEVESTIIGNLIVL